MVRSHTLYPAELRAHEIEELYPKIKSDGTYRGASLPPRKNWLAVRGAPARIRVSLRLVSCWSNRARAADACSVFENARCCAVCLTCASQRLLLKAILVP